MRAAWFESNGPAHEVLKVGERPDPKPEAGEVVVRVHTSGVNPSDVKRRAGWNNQTLDFPYAVPNNDGAGVIVGVGEGVSESRINERVWLHSTGWKRPLGTAATLTVTPSARACLLPDATSFEIGAGLGVPAMTAHRAVFGLSPVEGKTIVVAGAAGAVGFYAVQLAKWGGATVIATASSPEKAQIARDAGADHVIDYRRENVSERVMEITQSQGVDHVVEVDFGSNLVINLAILKNNGSIASYASMGDPTPKLPFYQLMTKNICLLSLFVYEMPQHAQDQAKSDIFSWLGSAFAVPPPIHSFPLDRIADAHVAVEQGVIGKVVVQVVE